MADAARLARRIEDCDEPQARDDVLALVLLSRPCEALRLRDQAVLALYGQVSQVASQPGKQGSHACRVLMSEMLEVWQRALVEVEPLREAACAMKRSHDEALAAARSTGHGVLPSMQPWQHAWEAQMDAHERIVERLEALIDERLEEEVEPAIG